MKKNSEKSENDSEKKPTMPKKMKVPYCFGTLTITEELDGQTKMPSGLFNVADE